jgi:hypothetical protein
MKIEWPTAAQVRQYRDDHETDMFTANKALTKKALLEAADKAETVEDMRDILKTIILHFAMV